MKISYVALLVIISATSAFSADCLQVAVKERQDFLELSQLQNEQARNQSDPDREIFYQRGRLEAEIYQLTSLIDLYTKAYEKKCEGVVRDLFDILSDRSVRFQNYNRTKKQFSSPSCDELMIRINKGRAGEFCPGEKIGNFVIEKIRKLIEFENRINP